MQRAVAGLALAAAPTFAAMALATQLGGGVPDLLCRSAPTGLPLDGMVLMYLLMAAFHLPPWLRLLARPRRQEEALAANPASAPP